MERIQTVRRLRLEMEKLDKSGTIVWSSQVSVNRRERDEAVASLEEILLSEAEMVFATLSSTQRDVFKNAARKAPFHTGMAYFALAFVYPLCFPYLSSNRTNIL